MHLKISCYKVAKPNCRDKVSKFSRNNVDYLQRNTTRSKWAAKWWTFWRVACFKDQV